MCLSRLEESLEFASWLPPILLSLAGANLWIPHETLPFVFLVGKNYIFTIDGMMTMDGIPCDIKFSPIEESNPTIQHKTTCTFLILCLYLESHR